MSFSKSRVGVGVLLLAVILLTPCLGHAAAFDAVQMQLRTQVTASVGDFNLNIAPTGSTALFYFDQEFLPAQQSGELFPVDSRAAAAAVSWEILWQQPALIPVSVVPEPTAATFMLAATVLMARRFRAKRTLTAA